MKAFLLDEVSLENKLWEESVLEIEKLEPMTSRNKIYNFKI